MLEARDAIGGTWDLFRYPACARTRICTRLATPFRPWREAKAIADGPAILRYVRETAEAFGIDRKIRYNTRLRRADWSSERALWAVEAERGPERETVSLTCGFLFMCTGYYDYAEGYMPEWLGIERFGGRIVHPQQWPDDLDYAGKRVVIIGSGATAVTLAPAMAEAAARHDGERPPTYIVARPSQDKNRRPPTPRLALAARALARAKQTLAWACSSIRSPARARPRQRDDPRDGARAAPARLQRREELLAELQSLGSAALPSAGRRLLRGDPRGHGLGDHRCDRNLHGAANALRRGGARRC